MQSWSAAGVIQEVGQCWLLLHHPCFWKWGKIPVWSVCRLQEWGERQADIEPHPWKWTYYPCKRVHHFFGAWDIALRLIFAAARRAGDQCWWLRRFLPFLRSAPGPRSQEPHSWGFRVICFWRLELLGLQICWQNGCWLFQHTCYGDFFCSWSSTAQSYNLVATRRVLDSNRTSQVQITTPARSSISAAMHWRLACCSACPRSFANLWGLIVGTWKP